MTCGSFGFYDGTFCTFLVLRIILISGCAYPVNNLNTRLKSIIFLADVI
jgi:hypothetical protein